MLFWSRTRSRLFYLQTLIFEFFIRSQERGSTSWHTTSSWILTKEIVNRHLMSHNKIYIWRKKYLWRIILGTVIVPFCYPILIDVAFLNVHASTCSSWWRIPVTQIKLSALTSLRYFSPISWWGDHNFG